MTSIFERLFLPFPLTKLAFEEALQLFDPNLNEKQLALLNTSCGRQRKIHPVYFLSVLSQTYTYTAS